MFVVVVVIVIVVVVVVGFDLFDMKRFFFFFFGKIGAKEEEEGKWRGGIYHCDYRIFVFLLIRFRSSQIWAAVTSQILREWLWEDWQITGIVCKV